MIRFVSGIIIMAVFGIMLLISFDNAGTENGIAPGGQFTLAIWMGIGGLLVYYGQRARMKKKRS